MSLDYCCINTVGLTFVASLPGLITLVPLFFNGKTKTVKVPNESLLSQDNKTSVHRIRGGIHDKRLLEILYVPI